MESLKDKDSEGCVVLYQPPVPMTFECVNSIGAGLVNCGNTCFLNAGLQCLSHLPPLVNLMLRKEHTGKCLFFGFC